MLPQSNRIPTDAETYRKPMLVTAVRCYPASPELFNYPLCPRCSSPMEREYQNYCDQCGQALDWKMLSKTIVALACPPNEAR